MSNHAKYTQILLWYYIYGKATSGMVRRATVHESYLLTVSMQSVGGK